MTHTMTRRTFAKLSTAAFSAGVAPSVTVGSTLQATSASHSDTLKSEFLLDLILETLPANNVGGSGLERIVVPVAGGTFEGPNLKGTVVTPCGDWILRRPDGSLILDVRLMLKTDDDQKIYVAWRGIYYAPQGKAEYARILPMFETGAPKYAWLNNIVAVGVHQPMAGKVAYRIYQIL